MENEDKINGAQHQAADNEAGKTSRRQFLKAAGLGVAGAAALAAGGSHLGLFPGRGEVKSALPDIKETTYRLNPKNGDKVSLLGFGCMRFPVLPEATAPNSPQIDEAASFRLIDRALEAGVNFFDTSWLYHGGQSEVVMGRALKRHPRDSYFISDKMPPVNPDLAQAKEIFQGHLDRLQTDYIDYYLLHSLSTKEGYQTVYERNGVLDYLLEEKAAGRIRNLGWSFHGDEECLDYVLGLPQEWDFAMLQLNYHDLLHEYEPQSFVASRLAAPATPKWAFERLKPTGIPLLVMEPLLGGRLARLSRKALTILQQERPQDSAASWAFRYVGSLPNVLSVLSGMTYLEHLEDNLRTYGPLEPLSDRELAVLQKALATFISQEVVRCTTCGYCTPCRYGIDIPGVFSHFNRCVDDDRIPRGERNADYERARRAYLVGYDRSVTELAQAERCTGCNECLPRCPQRLDIPGELARLGRFAEQLRNEVA